MTITTKASKKSAEFTAQFIQQWMLHKSLQPTPEGIAEFEKKNSKCVGYIEKSTEKSKPFDLDEIKAGDIRQLSLPNGTFYALVIDKLVQSYIVIMFSEFSIPATDEEFLISNTRAQCPSVVQLRSTRALSPLLLRRSWLIDRVTDDEICLIIGAVEYTVFGNKVTSKFEDRVGLPITDPYDPRIDYNNKTLDRYTALYSAELDWITQRDYFINHVVWRRTSHIKDSIAPTGHQCLMIDKPSNRLLRKLKANEDVPVLKLTGHEFNWHKDARGQLVCSLNDPITTKGFYDVLFIRRDTRNLIGTGYADIKYDHTRIVLSDPLYGIDINCKRDIIAILCKAATI